MSRKLKVIKKSHRRTYLDPLYKDSKLSALINRMMIGGERAVAQKICYQSLLLIQQLTNKKAISILHQAIENIKPSLELRSLRVGKSNFQVPFPLDEKKKMFYALKWVVENANRKKGRPMEETLCQELIDASLNKGSSVEQKQRLHKMAEANRAYIKYRW